MKSIKSDLHAIKKELSRLANLEYMKKELNRLAGEVKNFDVHIPLTPQAKARLNKLERRFNSVLKSISDFQKQVDANVGKFLRSVRGKKAAPKAKRPTKSRKPKKATSTAKKTTARKRK